MAPAPHPSKGATGKSGGQAKRSQARAKDAVQILKNDHREVEKLFRDFESAGGQRKIGLASKICDELTIHTQIEEEILYPMAREFLKDDAIIDKSLVEHQGAKELIEQIDSAESPDEMFEAKVKVLQEQVEHHIQEEERQLFPQLQKSDMDLQEIAQQLSVRKQELMAEISEGARH